MRRALCYCLRTHDLCLTYRRVAASSTYDYQRVPNSAAGLDRCSRGDSPHVCGVRVVVSGSVCASAVDSYGVTGSPRTVTCAPAERGEWARRGLRLAGDNSSNTHTTQGSGWRGSQQHLHQQINTLHARRPDPPTGSERQGMRPPRAGRGQTDLSMVMNRAPAPHRSNIMHCMHAHAPQTLYHRARMHPIPFQIMGWPCSVHLHLRCPSTGLKPNVASATCPSFCRICLPVLMPYATTDPSAIRLRRLLGA